MREWLAREAELVGEGISTISPAKRGDVTTERLKDVFMRCDSSGDGRIDATEFRIAYRLLSGDDLPISDCEISSEFLMSMVMARSSFPSSPRRYIRIA